MIRKALKLVMFVVLTIFMEAPAHADNSDALFLDMGGFGIYRLNQDELNMLQDEHILQAYETYVRRYFAAFMYITRNIVSIEVHEGYSPKIVNPIIQDFNQLPAQERRQRIYDLYLKSDGLKIENNRIFSKVIKLVDDWDVKHGYSRLEITMPDHDPNDIRKLYLRKLGLPERHFVINKDAVKNPLVLKAINSLGFPMFLFLVFGTGLILGVFAGRLSHKNED